MAGYTEDELQRIAHVVERERLERGWSKEQAARQAGMSSITWKRVEDALPVQPVKLRAVEKALDGEYGALARAAAGAPFVSVPRPAAPPTRGTHLQALIDSHHGEPLPAEIAAAVREWRDTGLAHLLPLDVQVQLARHLQVRPAEVYVAVGLDHGLELEDAPTASDAEAAGHSEVS